MTICIGESSALSLSFPQIVKDNWDKHFHHYGDDQCEECGARICVSRNLVTFASPVLIFSIVRPAVAQSTDTTNTKNRPQYKTTHAIEFPLELNLNGILSCSEKRDWPNYSLRAFIYHISESDSISKGHYIAVVKSGEKWFHCNDHLIEEIDEVFSFLEP